MNLRCSESYQITLDKARWSHANGRRVFHIEERDIQRGRLFAYAFRSQTIGLFHATRLSVQARLKRGMPPGSSEYSERAIRILEQLQAHAIQPVPRDFRVLLSTLYY